MPTYGEQLARDYSKGNLIGWAEVLHPGIADEEFRLVGGIFIPFRISGQTRSYTGRKTFLYPVVRQALGKDLENIAQEIGDCVSWGCRNATDYLGCCDILVRKDAEKWRPSFPPYFYGTGRVLIGKGQIPANEDGSLGAWMAAAVIQYGTIFRDEPGCPQYSGNQAKKWGAKPGPDQKWVDFGKNFLIKSAAKIDSWDKLCEAVHNGYPCTVASNQGFEMEAGSDGFHAAKGNWGHQMSIVGVDEEYQEPYALIRNSWGDVHGHLKDFQTGEQLPVGYIRAKRRVIEGMINAGETFAFSQYDQFHEQKIDDALFKIVGR
jgi:hypothetical protein